MLKMEDMGGSGSMGSFASMQGKEFANTVTYISRGDYIPRKKTYPAFRKIFYEEAAHNPAIKNPNDEAYTYHEMEQKKYWYSKGKSFDTQERFVEEKDYSTRGPVKAAAHPHFFENGQKYFGRQRKILPYLRAQLYTRPMSRVDEDLRAVQQRIMHMLNLCLFLSSQKAIAQPIIGPQTYDLGDYWQPKSYSTVGAPNR